MGDVSDIVGYIGERPPCIPPDCPPPGPALNDPRRPYATIDEFYNEFRPLYPAEILTAQLIGGNYQMNREEYIGLIVTNPAKNATVTIPGRIGETVLLSLVRFSADLTVVLPKDLRPIEDVPVIRTSIFLFDLGYSLTISEVDGTDTYKDGLNTKRIIFEHTDITDIRERGGLIIINRAGTVHRAGTRFYSDVQNGIDITTNCSFYLQGPDTVEASVNFPTNTRITLHNVSNDQSIRAFVIGRQTDSLIDGNLLFFALNFRPEDRYKIHSQGSFTSRRLVAVSNFDVQGGTIQSDTEGQIYLTDAPNADIKNVNLVNVIPFDGKVASETADYTIIQEYNSYNNSGSIFRKDHLITTDYTHTQFDGNVFLIDASKNNIRIVIPGGAISDQRLFRYKRIDRSSNSVVITAENRIEGKRKISLRNRDCQKSLPYVELYGANDKIYIFSRSR